jgi:hypothetical protein
MRDHDESDLTSEQAVNKRCPYCGCPRGDMIEPFEDHVLDCQPVSL